MCIWTICSKAFIYSLEAQPADPTWQAVGKPESQSHWQRAGRSFTCIPLGERFEPRTFFSTSQVPRMGCTSEPSSLWVSKALVLSSQQSQAFQKKWNTNRSEHFRKPNACPFFFIFPMILGDYHGGKKDCFWNLFFPHKSLSCRMPGNRAFPKEVPLQLWLSMGA